MLSSPRLSVQPGGPCHCCRIFWPSWPSGRRTIAMVRLDGDRYRDWCWDGLAEVGEVGRER